MWKKIAVPALFLMLSVLDSPAQSAYCWNWTKAAGGTNDDGGTLIALYQNYIYNSGVFTSPTITFDDSVYLNRGRKDIFLTKHDTKGNLIWSKTIGGPLNETPAGMAVDSRGDVYIGGTFSGPLDCDNVALPGAGGTDIFIAKYAATGSLQWVKDIGSADNDSLLAMIIDQYDQVRLVGRFSGTLSLGQFVLTGTKGREFTASLLGGDGTVVYAREYPPPAYLPDYTTLPPFIRLDKKGNIYYASYTYDTISIGGVRITPNCETYFNSVNPAFWGAKLDTAGNVLWAKDFAPCSQAQLQYFRKYMDFYVDDLGYVYITYVDGRWPKQYGPNPGDPYVSWIRAYSTDGAFVGESYMQRDGFLDGGVILRYILYARNKSVLLNVGGSSGLQYFKEVGPLNYATPPLTYEPTRDYNRGVFDYHSGIADTINKVFYFTGKSFLNKLSNDLDIYAGGDQAFCAPYPVSVRIGSYSAANCGTPPYKYKWFPAIGLDYDSIPSPTVQLSQIDGRQKYYLTVTDAAGTIKQDSARIIKYPSLQKPVIMAYNNVLFISRAGYSSVQWYRDIYLENAGNKDSLALRNDGKYTVRVTDSNGCTNRSDTFFAYKIAINAGRDTTICLGKSVVLGGTPTASTAAGTLTYAWTPAYKLTDTSKANPVATPEYGISYKLIARNSFGNNAVDSVRIDVYLTPPPVITQDGNVLHSGYASGNQWFLNGQPLVTATGESLTITVEGNYSVQVTDQEGCSAMSPVLAATLTPLKISVFPSPSSGAVNIQYNLPLPTAIVVDIFDIGKGARVTVLDNVWQEAGYHTLNLKSMGFSKGIYLVRITTQAGRAMSKFAVQ